MSNDTQVPTADQKARQRISDFHNEALASSWLEAVIESAEDAVISKTLDGILTSWNKSAERMFGYKADEVIGKPVTVLFPPDRIDEEAIILGRIARGERIGHFETVRRRKDGSLFPVSLSISPIKTEDGRIVGASKIVRDISTRVYAETQLREQTEVVETINRVGRLLSAELDQQRLVQAVTDAATELTGAKFGAFFYNVYDRQGGSYMLYALSGAAREDFEDFPMPRATDLFGPTFRGEGTIRIDNIREDERYGRNPPYNGLPEGHLPVVSYLAVPVVSRSSDVLGGLFFGHSKAGKFIERHERIVEGLAAQAAVAMDNARLFEQAQQALNDKERLLRSEQSLREQAEAANRTKDEFLGLLSHELRTPLNSILGWTQMLNSRQLDPETFARAIETINRNARLQSRLIDDMLDVSRIISGKLRLDPQPVDLSTVINAAVDTLRPAAEAKEIRISMMLDFGGGHVLGDPVRLQQVVWNLISNAIKFTGKRGSVNVSLERIGSHYEIRVSDTGPGISEDFLPFVFDRFRQADSSTIKKFGGLGLGLAIVRQLVELHGGVVDAANRDDATGAVFTVRLPVMIVRKSIVETRPEVRERTRIDAPFDCPPQLAGVRVLAVDDEADSRFLLQTVLEQCGAVVRTVESAPEALDELDAFQPDILVSDIGMPDEDGYSLIRKIRAAEVGTGRRLPAVALTAFARIEDRLHALNAGYNMHVPKPVEPVELLVVVASLIDTRPTNS